MNFHIFLFWFIMIAMTGLALAFVLFPLFKARAHYKLTVLLVLLLPLFTLAYYLKFGSGQQVSEQMLAEERAAQIEAERVRLGTKENIINALQQKLKENPTSAQGWYLLGRMYLLDQNYAKAELAFNKADALEPNKPETMLSYAESSYFAHGQNLDAKATELLNNLLKMDPNNSDAINLLAINAYQQKQFQKAIDYWKSLLQKFPADSDDEKMLLTMIHNAKSQIVKNPLLQSKNTG